MSKLEEMRHELTSEARLLGTIERLLAEGHISAEEAARLREALPATIRESSYIVRHLGAHLAIGAVFAFDVIPLPLGTISRVLWVIGNRVYETLRGNHERKRVHSVAVLGIAAIPFIGYFAYLLPLRARSADAVYLYGNHITYRRAGCSLEEYLNVKPRFVRFLVHRVVYSGGQP